MRFTVRGATLYVTALAWPESGKIVVKALGKGKREVKRVELLGHTGAVEWTQTELGLEVMMPEKRPGDFAYVLKIQ